MKTTLCLLTLFLVPGLLTAQGQQYIDTIFVSSTQVPMQIQQTGRHIAVLDRETIKALPASSLDEVLQSVPGVEIQSRGGFGAQGDILMRGSTFTQVLVLIDGVRMNDPLTAHFNCNIPVTPEEIERIEILRGPAAAMYGPDAVGGVVNIITRIFDPGSELQSGGQVEIGVGSNNQQIGSLSLLHRRDRIALSGSYQFNRSDGEHFPALITEDQTRLDAYRSFFDIHTAGVSMMWQSDRGGVWRLRSGYDYRDFDARYFYTTSPFDKSTETVRNWFNLLQYDKGTDRRHTDVRLAYKRASDIFVFSPDFPSTNEHTTHFAALFFNQLHYVEDDFRFKWGAQLDRRQIISNDRGNHDDWHAGGYAMGVYQQDDLSLSGSLRLDYDENYDLEVSPQVNIAYGWGKWTFRGVGGRTIRAADYTERYVSNNLQNLTPERSLGNPALLAERSWSAEIGADLAIAPAWRGSATLYWRGSRELIDYVRTEAAAIEGVGDLQPNAFYFFAQNVTDVSTLGADFELNYRKVWSPGRSLQFNAGYTTIRTNNRDGVASVYIANHARHLVSNTLIGGWYPFKLSLSSLYKVRDPRQAEAIASALESDYLLLNTALSCHIKGGWILNVKIQNVFDTDYQNVLGARMPGRWVMGSIGYRW